MLELGEQALSVLVRSAAGVSAVVAVLVFAKSIYEYTLQNKLKRFEKYQDIAGQWDENKDLQTVKRLLDNEDSRALAEADPEIKQNFIHGYEDIAVMCESGLLSNRMAFYMFGYYAIRSHQSKEFWIGLNENDFYYTLFCRFAAKMKSIEDRVKSGREDVRNWKFKF